MNSNWDTTFGTRKRPAAIAPEKQNGRQHQLPAVKEGLRDVLYRCPPP
jgi:hypothetical protein